MPMLEIIGVTHVGNNFNVAIAFSRNKAKENYRWALEHLRSLFDEGMLLGVIVTNRVLGLIKVLECVFPGTYHLLCLFI